ncbi:MAG: prephenate dehydratase domain-containing protein, partial [Pyrinomonadaceae bacterium]
MKTEPIDDPRSEIDAIDRELLRLLNKRAEIALRVGATKTSIDTSLCDPNREREVLARLREDNRGPFDEQSIASIFQRIIDESLHLQQRTFHLPLQSSDGNVTKSTRLTGTAMVAFLGERGTFSEEAVLGILGENCQTVSFPTFDDLFKAIDEGKADYILTPLENSLVGSVHRCYELLLNSSLNITAEIILPVSHFLIASPEADFESIRTVESHPAALAQCERFFAGHPNLKGIAADDTAGSVRRAVESGDISRAGIGGKRAAEIYGGKILRSHIEDHTENYTRFALLAMDPDETNTGEKISLVIRLTHQPGALHNALRPFVRRGIDLLKIESRPIRDSPSEFNFYLDLLAPTSESELLGALNEINEQAANVRYLGRYSTI